jgi:hypothetical protein
LAIELPEPYFGATPCEYWSTALEPESYMDREPFLAPAGTVLLSKGKKVTSSAEKTIDGSLEQITDGDKSHMKNSLVTLKEGLQWVQLDLEQSAPIYAIVVWHFSEGKQVYFDVIVQLSDDPEFKNGVTTVYNNDFDNSAQFGVGHEKEYIEKYEGRLMPVDGVKARYVRLYSQGSTNHEMNHYVEVDVFGKPST